MNWYLKCLKQYIDFWGRARRKEYWMFTLWNVVITLFLAALAAIGTEIGSDSFVSYIPMVLYLLYGLFILIPSFTVSVRRLHDIGKSGWWILIGLIPLIGSIILLVWYCTEGQRCENEWGPDPKEGE